MRSVLPLALCALTLVVAACTDTPTATTELKLGQTTMAEFQQNAAWKNWYDTGFNAYPDGSGQASFDSAVNVIKSSFDPAVHNVVVVIKPNCGCQSTQLWMPRVMRTLSAAGVPESNIDIFITDSRLAGIDSIRALYLINEAPSFLVLKNNTVMNRINTAPPAGRSVEQELAAGFAKP